ERTMACGSLALISSTLAVCGMTSEYTLASRTRRAINCAYCAPKSTTKTGRGDADSIGSQGRGVRMADPFPHPPFNPCVRFSRTRLTDDLLDMVTQRRCQQFCATGRVTSKLRR